VDRVTAAIALGSNLGDRHAHLDYAVSALASLLENVRVSTYHETLPVGMSLPQPLFLNAAAIGETTLPARTLLDALLQIEQARGRERPHGRASRTLDLDLILWGSLLVDEPGLIVPHPRFRDRRFVLAPLAEIGPELRDPVSGRTIDELLRQLPPDAAG